MKAGTAQPAGLQPAIIFFSLYLSICLLVQFSSWFDTYDKLFWVEICMALITVIFAALNWKQIRPILRFNGFSLIRLVGAISIAIIFSVIVNVTIHNLNYTLFGTEISLYGNYRLYDMPVLVMIYSIAFNPALFEELAFRGVLYNNLSNFLDQGLVVLITAVAFALIHLSFFSLFWIIPFGLLLGAMRKTYNTIWYGVIFHFIFNLVACLFDLYKEGALSF